MTEPCENCGTPVQWIDHRPALALILGDDVAADMAPNPGFHETHSAQSPFIATISVIPHTSERCRAARRVNAGGAE